MEKYKAKAMEIICTPAYTYCENQIKNQVSPFLIQQGFPVLRFQLKGDFEFHLNNAKKGTVKFLI